MTPDEFHEAIHNDVGRPRREIRTVNVGHTVMKQVVEEPWAHRAPWASSKVYLQGRDVKVRVSLNLKRNGLSEAEYQRLSHLVFRGIRWYWSRPIRVNNEVFDVEVNATPATSKAVTADLIVEPGTSYARSYNLAILGIDGSFIYNAGFYGGVSFDADQDFMMTAAHEFGHSVLMAFGGLFHSWTHKGSTSIFQATTAATPGYPRKGEIDLMRYYDDAKATVPQWRMYQSTKASASDVKSLLWMSKLSF
jgi:hypothetical protein